MKNPQSLAIPPAISDYIKEHFRDDFLTEITSGKDQNGKVYFAVDVSQDETIYHLKFNESGALVRQETEPLSELPDDLEIDD